MENFRIYRRHEKGCPLFDQGMKSDIKKCTCPLWVDGSEAGKRVRKSLKTRSVARGLERLVRMQREAGLDDGPRAVPVSEAVALYMADCKARSLAPQTLRSYRARLDTFAQYFAQDQVRSITADSFAAFRTAHPCGKAPASTRAQLIVLRTFLKFCLNRKWTAENPARGTKPPKLTWNFTPPFTAAEVEAMLLACDQLRAQGNGSDTNNRERARALLLVMLYGGLRVSDAVKLRRTDVDFQNGKVLLRIQKTGQPLYTNLPADALAALTAVAVRGPCFFWSGTGKLQTAITSAAKTIGRIAKHAGVKGAHPHRFRDTFSVNLLANGVDIRTVQLLLGHASVVTTERHYAPYVAGTQRLIDTAVSTLHFGSRAPAVVNAPGHTRGNAQGNAGRPLPFALRSLQSA